MFIVYNTICNELSWIAITEHRIQFNLNVLMNNQFVCVVLIKFNLRYKIEQIQNIIHSTV